MKIFLKLKVPKKKLHSMVIIHQLSSTQEKKSKLTKEKNILEKVLSFQVIF